MRTALIENKFRDMRRSASHAVARGKERARGLEKDLEHVVQDHPIRSTLVTLGIGMVLGALIWRRF